MRINFGVVHKALWKSTGVREWSYIVFYTVIFFLSLIPVFPMNLSLSLTTPQECDPKNFTVWRRVPGQRVEFFSGPHKQKMEYIEYVGKEPALRTMTFRIRYLPFAKDILDILHNFQAAKQLEEALLSKVDEQIRTHEDYVDFQSRYISEPVFDDVYSNKRKKIGIIEMYLKTQTKTNNFILMDDGKKYSRLEYAANTNPFKRLMDTQSLTFEFIHSDICWQRNSHRLKMLEEEDLLEAVNEKLLCEKFEKLQSTENFSLIGHVCQRTDCRLNLVVRKIKPKTPKVQIPHGK